MPCSAARRRSAGSTRPERRFEIGADCTIREHVTMSCGSPHGGGVTAVGDRGYFMAYSHIAHDCHIGDGVTFANGVQLGGHVHIGEGANFGGLSAVQQFGRVGRFAFVGGVTGINEDIIPYGMAFGDHAELAGLNLIGLKRRGVPRPNIHALRGAFRAIFQDEDGTIADRARQRARERWHDMAEVQEVVAFILADAKRPICTARKRGAGRRLMATLGIIAGGGRLPLAVAEAVAGRGPRGVSSGAQGLRRRRRRRALTMNGIRWARSAGR